MLHCRFKNEEWIFSCQKSISFHRTLHVGAHENLREPHNKMEALLWQKTSPEISRGIHLGIRMANETCKEDSFPQQMCSQVPHAHIILSIILFLSMVSSTTVLAESSPHITNALVDVASRGLGGVAYWGGEGKNDEHSLRWGAQNAIDGDISTGWCQRACIYT